MLATFVLLVGVADGLPLANHSVCDEVRKVVDECPCTDLPPLGAKVVCSKDLFGDEVDLELDFVPCAEDPYIDLTVSESLLNMSKRIADIRWGVNQRFPIPFLQIKVPVIKAKLDVDAIVNLDGPLNATVLDLGLDACGTVLGRSVCGEKLWDKLPVWVLKDKKLDFSSVCDGEGRQYRS